MFIPEDQGPQVFRQLVLPFGGTGSVWAYLQITDKICFLTLVLVFLPAAHFVDDFYYSQPSRTASSGFSSFCSIQSLLGVTTKESKAQKPIPTSTLLGVAWNILKDSITAGPSETGFRNCPS